MPRSPSGAYRTARTAAAASAPLATPGTWIPSTPSSSVCLMIVGSFAATRTIVCAGVAASASTTRAQRRQRERTVLGVDDDVVEAGGAEERRQPGLGKRQDRPGEGLGCCKAGTQARELGGHQSFRRPACSSSGRTASA